LGEKVCRVGGKRPRGRPKRNWRDVMREDMKRIHLSPNDAEDRVEWRRLIHGCNIANQGTP
jgi:hypothetical protein